MTLSLELARRASELVVPFEVLFELTYACNLRCQHCYVVEHVATGQLSTPEVLRVLDELAAGGCLYLTLSGGEPLTRPDFWAIAAEVRRRAFAFRLFTNATLIGPWEASYLADLSPLSAEISVYGSNPRTHDGVTGEVGSLARTLEGVGHLRRAGVPVVLKTPLMRDNVAEYEEILRLASDLGCSARFDPVIAPRDDRSREPLRLRLEPHQLARVLADGRLFPPMDPQLPPGPGCEAGRNSCSVSPTGIVRPCIQLPLECGDLRQQSFCDIWVSSPVLRYLRQLRDEDHYLCYHCRVAGYCHRCPGLALLEDGDLLGPSTVACQIAWVQNGIAGGVGTAAAQPSTLPRERQEVRR